MADRQKKQRSESSAGAGSSKAGLKVKDAEVSDEDLDHSRMAESTSPLLYTGCASESKGPVREASAGKGR